MNKKALYLRNGGFVTYHDLPLKSSVIQYQFNFKHYRKIFTFNFFYLLLHTIREVAILSFSIKFMINKQTANQIIRFPGTHSAT